MNSLSFAENKRLQAAALKVIHQIRDSGGNLPATLRDIPHFPFENFPELQEAVLSGRYVISRFAFRYELELFNLIATRFEFLKLQAAIILTYAMPLAALVLAFLHSWWWLFGLFSYFVGMRWSKNAYNGPIHRAARSSEAAFCLLFYTSQVHVYDLEEMKEYEWKLLTRE